MSLKKHLQNENEKEFRRVLKLSEFDLDYTNLEKDFIDLNKLAASITHMEISQLNLFDAFSQWSVSQVGTIELQTPREETICNYTIKNDKPMEVNDLSTDPRFKDIKSICEAGAKYYYGVPLKTKEGFIIGSFCVIGIKLKGLSQEKKMQLSIITQIIEKKLEALKITHSLERKISKKNQASREITHDLRGMINGISGIGELIGFENTGKSKKIDKFLKLQKESCKTVLEYVETILSEDRDQEELEADRIYIGEIIEKLKSLYLPLAIRKDISLVFHSNDKGNAKYLPMNTIIQILGNLISNAIKFTPAKGNIDVSINLASSTKNEKDKLKIEVKDDGVGIKKKEVEKILRGEVTSKDGTEGEAGYGIGLNLVSHHIELLKGTISINSKPEKGSVFLIELPINKEN